MKLMILDGNSIINRAYFGVHPLNAPDGTPTNAVFGFLNIFSKLMTELSPEAVCVTFDLKAPTFRHKACDFYKAQRKPTPEDLVIQIELMKDLLDKMGIRHYEAEGYEADDILGTVGRICAEKGWECIVVTGDKDSLQLVNDRVSVCNIKTRMGKTETILYTPEVFFEEYGFPPAGIVDLKALMGDTSDNIPGVPGIGEKTAMSLVQSYGTLENIYKDLAALDIKDGVRKKLAEGRESAEQSYWLATILRDVPVSFAPEENLWNNDFRPGLYELLARLGFRKYIEKWNVHPSESTEKSTEAASSEILPFEQVTVTAENAEQLAEALENAELIAVAAGEALDSLSVCDGKKVYTADRLSCFLAYDGLLNAVFAPERKIIAHNCKELIRQLMEQGAYSCSFVFDTALAAYLISSTDSDYQPEDLSQRYLGKSFSGAEACFRLKEPLENELEKLGMTELFRSVEMPLCEVLASMEIAGMYVDKKALADFGGELSVKIEDLKKSIWDLAGDEFNINSPKQLGEILFDKLLLPYGKKTKTGWSTNAEVLEKLRSKHPIVDRILEYRELTKLKSTYTDGLQKVIAPDGRIHTNFQMTVTATGRLSSTEPNLQNIPVRKQLGAEIRKMFIAEKGNVLVDADYSQIELRLLSHISEDEAMQQAFLSGEDFHTVTAASVFGVPVSEVTPAMRSGAKAVNFGIIYGISAFSLSQDIGVTTKEAQAYIDAYLSRFRGVQNYRKTVVENARENGYVSTVYGRRRDLPELKNSNFNVRSFGERVALNMPIQGTAADIIKLAMISVYHALKKEGLKGRLILQVHDELIVECPEDEKERVGEIVRNCMENVAALSVPLAVDVNSGRSWAEAH